MHPPSKETASGIIVDRVNIPFTQHVSMQGRLQAVEFEQEVVWLARTESAINLVHGGKIVQEYGVYNDFFGYLRSLDSSVDETPGILESYSIEKESSLSLEITTTVYLSAYQEDDECRDWNQVAKENRKKFKFVNVPEGFHVPFETGDEKVKVLYRRLERLNVAEEVVWSSQRSSELNSSAVAAFKNKWNDASAPSICGPIRSELERIQSVRREVA